MRSLRKSLGLTQTEFGQKLAVSQAAVGQWERGEIKPSLQSLKLIATIFDLAEGWLSGEVVIKESRGTASGPDRPAIPLLRDAVAAGPPRAIDERQIEAYLDLPAYLVGGRRDTIVAVPVVGDSMAPVLEQGYVALIDTSQRDPRRLVNQMVAARADDGVTIKWLRKSAKNSEEMYILVPNHTSLRHPLRIIVPGSESVSIVGKVVKWIGEPRAPGK